MLRPKFKTSISDRLAVIAERILQALLVASIFGVVYRYCYIDVSDPFKCSALLNKGEWVDPGPRWSKIGTFKNWQPPGCIMHQYTKTDIQDCFQRRRLVFVGDSTTRQVYWAVAKKMNQTRAEREIKQLLEQEPDEKHKDLEFTSDGVMVRFIWDPWLNSTGLEQEMKMYQAHNIKGPQDKGNESAGMILLGAPGLWYARHGKANYFRDFRNSIDAIIPYMDHVSEVQEPVSVKRPFPSRDNAPNLLLLAPVQTPRYQSLSPSREETMTPLKIDQMNDYLQQASAHSNADVIWSYSLMTHGYPSTYEESGLHVTDSVAQAKADVLLNLRCNADAADYGKFDRTCCTNYTTPGATQWMVILVGLLLQPAVFFARRKHFIQISRFLPSSDNLAALTSFGLIICFCFYTDRTQIFEKAAKQYDLSQILTACSVVAAMGVLSLRRNRTPTANSKAPAVASAEHEFLSREQSDEWKGWMQFLILLYHYFGASKVLWIYEVIRLLVASYLFMTGFGHTMYFLKEKDFSLHRFASVLIRLNLLSCVLPYMMRSNYLFYYFAPLVSFWFVVIFFTLKVGHSKNTSVNFLAGKIVLSAILTTAFTMIPGILESISFLLRYTCAISWNAAEWRFRTFLDMYVVYVGMFIAVLVHRSSQLESRKLQPTAFLDHIIQVTIDYRLVFRIVLLILATGLLPLFWLVTMTHTKKQDYNFFHPFVSWISVLCIVVLRNSSLLLRSYHSAVFAWLGRISLETYILQYHIWLAGDTKGILRLGLWNKWIEAAVLTPVFFWLSWCCADSTQILTEWMVGAPAFSTTTNENARGGAKGSPYLLPRVRTEDGEGTPSKDLRFEYPGPAWVNKFAATLAEDLRWRLGFITFCLWIGNVTYT